jgi:hypothetical protein
LKDEDEKVPDQTSLTAPTTPIKAVEGENGDDSSVPSPAPASSTSDDTSVPTTSSVDQEAEVKPKIRPLAARRNLVKAQQALAAVQVADSDETIPTDTSTSSSSSSSEVKADPASPMVPDLVRKVEEDVRNATASFDDAMMKSTDGSGPTRRLNKAAATAANLKNKSRLQASQIMRLIRCLAVIIFGAGTGE